MKNIKGCTKVLKGGLNKLKGIFGSKDFQGGRISSDDFLKEMKNRRLKKYLRRKNQET